MLIAPFASILLLVAVSLATTNRQRFVTVLSYYLIGSVSIIGAIEGFYGDPHTVLSLISWFASSLLLAAPWVLARNSRGVLLALVVDTLSPLGLIGWLSPLNAAGVLFPGVGWAGIMLTLAIMMLIPRVIKSIGNSPVDNASVIYLVILCFLAALANMSYQSPVMPKGWVGINTTTKPGGGNVLAAIQNNQDIINSALTQGRGAKVIVLPEAVIDNWLAGTRRQFANAVPAGQTWLVGAQTEQHNSVAKITSGESETVIDAAAVLLGGNWQPWSKASLHPAWWQRMTIVDGKRVWVSVCVEQVLPWTWFEALLQKPEIILAISNQWWAAKGLSAPQIQRDSVYSWSRLIGVPVLYAVNR